MIKLVTQPTDNSCVSACLSMISGIDIDKIMEVFHDSYYNHETTIYAFLDLHNIPYLIPDAKLPEKNFLWGGHTYLLSVPSLNIEGGLHAILVQYDGDKLFIFDPQKGNSDKKYYADCTLTENKVNGVALTSWIIDAVFDNGDLK